MRRTKTGIGSDATSVSARYRGSGNTSGLRPNANTSTSGVAWLLPRELDSEASGSVSAAWRRRRRARRVSGFAAGAAVEVPATGQSSRPRPLLALEKRRSRSTRCQAISGSRLVPSAAAPGGSNSLTAAMRSLLLPVCSRLMNPPEPAAIRAHRDSASPAAVGDLERLYWPRSVASGAEFTARVWETMAR